MNFIQSDVFFSKGTIFSSTQFTVLGGQYFHGTFLQLKRRFLWRRFSLSLSFFSL